MATTRERQKRAHRARRRDARISVAASRSWWQSDWAFCFGLVVITLALYLQIIRHPFINYDDNGYVTENLHVHAGLTWQTVVWAFTAIEQSNWHPLTWLAHALNYQIFGLDAGGHHLTSLLIHTINVLLLFLLLRRATGELTRSFVVAALFAVHPFNVESVAWAAELKNVLSTMFLFLTLAAYGWYARRPNWRRYLLVAAFFAAGLASKPMLVTLPFVLLLLDYWPLQRTKNWIPTSHTFPVPQVSASQLALEKLPLLVLSVASAVITVIAQKTGGALESIQKFPLGIRIETALSGYALYILKTFWPFSFALYYPNPLDPYLNQKPAFGDYTVVALGAVLLMFVSLVAWRFRREHPYLFVGWFWYVITLVPVIGLVKVGAQVIADRYAYVPLIGIFIALVWEAADLARAWNIDIRLRFAVVAVILAALFGLSFAQVRYWRSPLDIFLHTLNVTKNNYVANDKVAVLLFRQGNPESLRYYAEAARIAPWDAMSHEAVAGMLDQQGRYQEAIQAYDVVLRGSKEPEVLGLAHCNLSVIYSLLGNYSEAHIHAQEAMRIAPARVEAMIRGLTRVYSQDPTAKDYVRLSLLLEVAGHLEEARAACRKASELDPGSAEVKNLLDHLGRE